MVAVVQSLGYGHGRVIPLELDLCAGIVQIIVGLTIIKVEIADGLLGVQVGVDKQVDWVVDCLEERHSSKLVVQKWNDTAFTDEHALLDVPNRDCLVSRCTSNRLAGPVVIPVDTIWQVASSVDRRVVIDVLLGRRGNLRANQELFTKHPLLEEIKRKRVLRELVEHGPDDGCSGLS